MSMSMRRIESTRQEYCIGRLHGDKRDVGDNGDKGEGEG
jgi:hypothetical protein